ncbi:MAG: hypothetical protein RJA70_707 [Pseudomonadota bacterium]|jgi:hypothetical protein
MPSRLTVSTCTFRLAAATTHPSSGDLGASSERELVAHELAAAPPRLRRLPGSRARRQWISVRLPLKCLPCPRIWHWSRSSSTLRIDRYAHAHGILEEAMLGDWAPRHESIPELAVIALGDTPEETIVQQLSKNERGPPP